MQKQKYYTHQKDRERAKSIFVKTISQIDTLEDIDTANFNADVKDVFAKKEPQT